MKISVNTETEELEELRHAVAIIEDAIKRRENPDLYEEEAETKSTEQEKRVELKRPEPQQEKVAVQTLKVETPEVGIKLPEINIPKPISYSQVQQAQQVQKPAPISSIREERGSTPDIDISALSMSNYGESREGRKTDGMAKSSSSFSSSSQQSSSTMQPRGFEPRGNNNESAVKDIVGSLRGQRPGQPIQMSDILSKARNRNISEQETRNLVSKLQREGSI